MSKGYLFFISDAVHAHRCASDAHRYASAKIGAWPTLVWMHNSGLEVLTRLSMWKPKTLPTFRVCKFICDASGPNIWLWLIPYSSDGLQWPHAAHPGQTKSKKFFHNSTFKSPGAWMSLRKVILVKLQLSLSVSIHFSLFLCHDGSRVRVRHIN